MAVLEAARGAVAGADRGVPWHLECFARFLGQCGFPEDDSCPGELGRLVSDHARYPRPTGGPCHDWAVSHGAPRGDHPLWLTWTPRNNGPPRRPSTEGRDLVAVCRDSRRDFHVLSSIRPVGPATVALLVSDRGYALLWPALPDANGQRMGWLRDSTPLQILSPEDDGVVHGQVEPNGPTEPCDVREATANRGATGQEASPVETTPPPVGPERLYATMRNRTRLLTGTYSTCWTTTPAGDVVLPVSSFWEPDDARNALRHCRHPLVRAILLASAIANPEGGGVESLLRRILLELNEHVDKNPEQVEQLSNWLVGLTSQDLLDRMANAETTENREFQQDRRAVEQKRRQWVDLLPAFLCLDRSTAGQMELVIPRLPTPVAVWARRLLDASVVGDAVECWNAAVRLGEATTVYLLGLFTVSPDQPDREPDWEDDSQASAEPANLTFGQLVDRLYCGLGETDRGDDREIRKLVKEQAIPALQQLCRLRDELFYGENWHSPRPAARAAFEHAARVIQTLALVDRVPIVINASEPEETALAVVHTGLRPFGVLAREVDARPGSAIGLCEWTDALVAPAEDARPLDVRVLDELPVENWLTLADGRLVLARRRANDADGRPIPVNIRSMVRFGPENSVTTSALPVRITLPFGRRVEVQPPCGVASLLHVCRLVDWTVLVLRGAIAAQSGMPLAEISRSPSWDVLSKAWGELDGVKADCIPVLRELRDLRNRVHHELAPLSAERSDIMELVSRLQWIGDHVGFARWRWPDVDRLALELEGTTIQLRKPWLVSTRDGNDQYVVEHRSAEPQFRNQRGELLEIDDLRDRVSPRLACKLEDLEQGYVAPAVELRPRRSSPGRGAAGARRPLRLR